MVGVRVEPPIADRVLANFAPPASDRVVIVAIDEATMAELATRLPVDRGFLAGLIATIDAAGPAAIGLDLVFVRPTEPVKDDELAAAIGIATAPLIVGWANERDGLTRSQTAYATRFPGAKGLTRLPRGPADGAIRLLPEAIGRVPPLALGLAEAVKEAAVMPHGRIVYAAGEFATYPAAAVPRLPASRLAGKFVLIGTTLGSPDGYGPDDLGPTGAVGSDHAVPMASVTVHAHILSQLLSGAVRSATPDWALVVAAIAAGFVGTALRPLGPLGALGAGLATLTLGAGVAWSALAFTALTPPMATPALAFIIAGAAAVAQRMRADRRRRLWLQAMFPGSSQPARERLFAADRVPGLGAERREITSLCVELTGCAGLAERLDPGSATDVLNSNFDGIVGCVLDAGGTVVTVAGGTVTAVFGAPEPQHDHEERAAACARAIDGFAASSRLRLQMRGIAPGATLIGVHTGSAVIGHFGGSRDRRYGAVGASVELSATIAALNRIAGTAVLVSERTRRRAAGAFRSVGRLAATDGGEPVRCFEPVDHPDHAYESAYATMASGDDFALRLFENLSARSPGDRLVRLHLDRLRAGATDDHLMSP